MEPEQSVYIDTFRVACCHCKQTMRVEVVRQRGGPIIDIRMTHPIELQRERQTDRLQKIPAVERM